MDKTLPPELQELPRKLRAMNWPLMILVYGLVLVGVAFIYGTGAQTRDILIGFEGKWIKQLVWAGLGSCLMMGIALMDYRRLNRYAAVVYFGTVVMLIAVLIPGIGSSVHGARSWFMLGPFSVQPSEFAKWGTLVSVAALAGQTGVKFDSPWQLMPFVLLAGLPTALVIIQPDMGSAMVMGPVLVAILIISGAKIRWFVNLGLIACLLAPVMFVYGLKRHQKERVLSFSLPAVQEAVTWEIMDDVPGGDRVKDWEASWRTDPQKRRDLHEWTWNAEQSQLAVGSGGWLGKGYMQGTQNTLGFLPRTVAPTDFIFSVIAEETGFVGSVGLLTILAGVLLLCIHTATKADDAFGRNLCIGVAALIAFHIFINVGMTIGVLPVIGIPLPFISYGGSFMWLCMACIGLVQSVHIRRRI